MQKTPEDEKKSKKQRGLKDERDRTLDDTFPASDPPSWSPSQEDKPNTKKPKR